ncbi:MAG: NAD(P)-binding protein, partial [Candidatus Moranbacteria bacterium]|nr:NAD(P)-binding protein [Candidatus Moranbacteria bacterium]
MQTKRYIKIFLSVLIALFLYLVFSRYDLSNLVDRSFLKSEIMSKGVLAPVFFVFMYVVITVLFVPASPMSILSGVLFGPFWGGVYVIFGAGIGSFLSFLLARYLARDLIKKMLVRWNNKFDQYDDRLKKHGFLTMLFLRITPIFPFNVLNYLAGLTKIRLRDYLWATLIGMIPGIFAFTYLGSGLIEFSPKSLSISLLLFLILALIGYLIQKTRRLGKNEYDLIVIGAGAAGLNIASFMNRAGFKVLLIDKSEKDFGGDCLNKGCIPSKAMLYLSRAVRLSKKLEKYGLKSKVNLSMAEVSRYIQSKIKAVKKHENPKLFSKKGVDVRFGSAKFVGKNQLKLNGREY